MKLFCFFCVLFSLNSASAQLKIFSNSEEITKILEEFAAGAEFYQIDYQPKMEGVKEIYLIQSPAGLISSYDNGVISINQKLVDYPALLRIHVFQALGLFYGLKLDTGRGFMSRKWFVISPENEIFALRGQKKSYYKKRFFEALKDKHEINYKTLKP